jgi:hypothetical protein
VAHDRNYAGCVKARRSFLAAFSGHDRVTPWIGKDNSGIRRLLVIELDGVKAGSAELRFDIGSREDSHLEGKPDAAVKRQIVEGLVDTVWPAIQELNRSALTRQLPLMELRKMFACKTKRQAGRTVERGVIEAPDFARGKAIDNDPAARFAIDFPIM